MLDVPHFRSTFATLAKCETEHTTVRWQYDDVDDGHYVEVIRAGRARITSHPAKSHAHAAQMFGWLSATAARVTPRFVPAEW